MQISEKVNLYFLKHSELKHLSNYGIEINRDSVSSGDRTRTRSRNLLQISENTREGISPVRYNKYFSAE